LCNGDVNNISFQKLKRPIGPATTSAIAESREGSDDEDIEAHLGNPSRAFTAPSAKARKVPTASTMSRLSKRKQVIVPHLIDYTQQLKQQ
jgi:hypothetical protein